MSNFDITLPLGYEPQPQDILCGKRKESFNHVGNRRFRITVSLYLQRYEDAPTRAARGVLIASVVDMIHSSGGRFLKQDSNGRWFVLDAKQARGKVGHALRDTSCQLQKSSMKRNRAEDRSSSDESSHDEDDDESICPSFTCPSNKRTKTLHQLEYEPIPVSTAPVAHFNNNDDWQDSANFSISQLDFLLDDLSSSNNDWSDKSFLGLLENIECM